MSDGIEDYLLFFRSRLGRMDTVTFETIEQVVGDNPAFISQLNADQLGLIKRKLMASFTIIQGRGSSVLSDYDPWLAGRKKEIDFYYWNRFRDYLLAKDILPPNIISTLDTVTDEILDYSGNPALDGMWSRRGMVMGHVQSGKTTNYSALICKAADAGYKIIILLAGITNSLRTQTQERIDESFIGKKSLFQATVTEPMTVLNFSEKKRFPAHGTSRVGDFSKITATTVGVSLSSLSEPIIFVTKKNKAVLKNLKEWIRDQNHGETVTEPLLLIDDEADNASINTSRDPSKSTAINHAIRDILQTFNRSTYIGYTATPFANIFIDPDSNDEMIGDELFPKNFIKSLDPPNNYAGATRLFLDDGDMKDQMVRIIDDYRDILPLKHKIEDELHTLPPSLFRAVRVFLLSRAIRYLRGDGAKHCTMMINVSRFNIVQARVEGYIYEYIQQLKNSIAVNARYQKTNSDPLIAKLRLDFEEEFSHLEFTVDEVLEILHDSTSTIGVMTINMRGGSLDYGKNKTQGLHIITIGGLALSRGLTLEGLTVSYILRNASASDTLMQMARWFGYRPDYEDICRLYLPESAADHYEQITLAIEELRSEVRNMEQLGKTPEDFGLKVRQSPTGIRITALNKMRSATELMFAQDYSGQHIEGHALFDNASINEAHTSALRSFFGGLGPPKPDDLVPFPIWRNVPGHRVAQLIQSFQFPGIVSALTKISGTRSLVDDYISDRISDELADWDIIVPGRKNQGGLALRDFVPSETLWLRSRLSGTTDHKVFRVTGTKNRIVDPQDAQLGLTSEQILEAETYDIRGDKKFCAVRSAPLLLIHLLGTGEESKIMEGQTVASFSICFPSTNIPARERAYQVNEVFRRSLSAVLDSESDDDEELIGRDG